MKNRIKELDRIQPGEWLGVPPVYHFFVGDCYFFVTTESHITYSVNIKDGHYIEN